MKALTASDHIGSCDTLTESTEFSAPCMDDSGLHDMVESPSAPPAAEGDPHPPAVCVLPATPRVYSCDTHPLTAAELGELDADPGVADVTGTSMLMAVLSLWLHIIVLLRHRTFVF